MKKISALALLFFICHPSIFSQSLYEVPLDERVNNSSLIVEGKVVKQETFRDSKNGIIRTASTIEVYKVFKGIIKNPSLAIITVGGKLGRKALFVEELANLSMEQTAVFMLNDYYQLTALPANYSTGAYQIFSSAQGVISYNTSSLDAQDVFHYYGGIETEWYSQLKSVTHQSYAEIKKVKFEVPRSVLAPPVITSFTPSTIRAGAILDPTNNELTITGTAFGTATGQAAVLFDNPNDGSGGAFSVTAATSLYIISWTDTEIKVKVPGNSGTGFIKVRDNLGNVGTSSSILQIEFGIQSLTDPTLPTGGPGAYQIKLMDADGTGGYTIHYSTSTAGSGADFSTSPEKIAFDRALDTWKNTTGFNVTVGAPTTNQAVAEDGEITIMWDNANTGEAAMPAGVLGITYLSANLCDDGNWEITDFDMTYRLAGFSNGSTIIFQPGPCRPTSNEVDFETVALHELGHAHSFTHINDPTAGADPAKVMNFSISKGAIRRSPDVSSYNAGVYALTASSQTYGTCGGPTAEMTPLASLVPSNDNCPGSFPGTITPIGTYPIDLRYSTSNKFVDPSTSQIVCSGTHGVYNTVYFPIRTDATGGNLVLYSANYVSQYDYSPCLDYFGVQMNLYQLSSCPGGSGFPAPIGCIRFNSSAGLGTFTGLSANSNYLLVFAGLNNTKATFDIIIDGSALPVTLQNFSAHRIDRQTVKLLWTTSQEINVKEFEIQKSSDQLHFSRVNAVSSKSRGGAVNTAQQYEITDNDANANYTYYRLRINDMDGKFRYSDIRKVNGMALKSGLRTIDARGVFQVMLDQGNQSVQYHIYTSTGSLVRTGTIKNSDIINLTELPGSIYIMKFTDKSGQPAGEQKIIIAH